MNKRLNPFQVVTAMVLAAALAFLPMQSMAATASATFAAASTNSLVSNTPGNINSITLTATGAVMTLRLIDMPSTTLTYIIGAYTNYTPTVYTNTATYTDILGNTVSNSYKYITNLATTVNQSTNNYRTIGVFITPANETLTINYDTLNQFVFGVGYTNVGGGSITVQYQALK